MSLSLSLSSSHPLSSPSPPLLCISHFVPVVPLQHLPTESKWKREENPLWIGVALFSPSLSAVWTSGPCCILMLRWDRGVGVGKEERKRFSLCQSPLKISEGRENEFKKTITKKESWGRGSMKQWARWRSSEVLACLGFCLCWLWWEFLSFQKRHLVITSDFRLYLWVSSGLS